MHATPGAEVSGRRRVRRAAVFCLIMASQFALFEAALHVWGSSEAIPSFQRLFETDPIIGHRLRRNTTVRFTTAEFDTRISINGAGVRDEEEIGPKARTERRIVVLGDSLVLSVQTPFEQTFGELLERRLNSRGSRYRFRVVNAGVQGYGPVEELLFWKALAPRLEPDLVIEVVFVGNDAEEAVGSAARLETGRRSESKALRDSVVARLRRVIRRSMVLQTLRLRVVAVTQRVTWRLTAPEPPLQTYAAQPVPRIAEGIAVTRRCLEQIGAIAAASGARMAVVLMPARFQVDDADYERLREAVAQAGGELVRDAATARFDKALSGLYYPRLDLLPALRRAAGQDLFFQQTAHLTPYGHEVVAEALDRFIQDNRLLEGENEGGARVVIGIQE
jgi:lysophospholipase L1-like esterase